MIPNADAGVTANGTGRTAHRLPSYLPAIYRDDVFLGKYLWAFEQLLLGLEQQIDRLAILFDPLETREEFLPWLASWVAFTLRSDLEPSQQRAFLARVIPLYRRRGTKTNLQDLLSIFTTGVPSIVESNDSGPAHHFRITLRLQQAVPETQLRQIAIAHALIDLEKPAHTTYDLDLSFPTMQIGVTSHIGIDTLLGTIETTAAGGTATVDADVSPQAQRALAAAGTRKPAGKGAKPKAGRETPAATKAPARRRRPKRDTD